MRLLKIVVLAGSIAAAGSVHAFGVGARVGTTGIGGDVAWSIAPTLSARLGYSGMSWNKGVSTNEVRYDGKLKLSNLNAFLDFSPLGPFRLTGGFIFNGNKYDMLAQPSGGTFRINGSTYQASDIGSLDGSVKSGRSAAPYLGIGYGNVSGLGVNFYADFGLMFQGSPRAHLNANCGPSMSAGVCAQFRSDVAAEEGRLQDNLKNFKYYPVANIGLTIGF